VLGIAGLLQPFQGARPADDRDVVSALALAIVLRLRNGVSRPTGVVFLLAYAAFLAIEVALAHGT